MEFTILMPCLNEEKTIKESIQAAKKSIQETGITAEILVIDNGCEDNSPKIAEQMGAKVVKEDKRGYGNALKRGIEEAEGKYIIMGDCDMSYDFSALKPFIDRLRRGDHLVVGDRFSGGIEAGAMPWSHKYIGNPAISFIGRRICKTKVKDFYCGLRGFNTDKIRRLCLRAPGMEFAIEMIVEAQKAGYKISNVPIVLHKDGRDGRSHLNTIKDGLRTFRYLYSAKWDSLC